jgi:hypothetical protein
METERDLVVASVSALVVFEIWKAYENNAPSIEDLRAATPGDSVMKQRILDTDFTIGSIALAIGLLFTIKAKDSSIIIITAALLMALSWWRYEILEGESASWNK